MRAHTDYLWFETKKRHELINITARVADIVEASHVQEGLCLVSAMHITAGIWVNDEESGLKHDVMVWLEHLAPAGDYRHHQHQCGRRQRHDRFGRRHQCARRD